MESLHKQEKVLQNFQFDGASAQLVEWTETLWCGKVKYAPNCTDEPDVEKLMEEFVALGEAELSPVDPEGFDLLWLPGGRFLRVEINESTAQALDSEPWTGGVPPYQWVSDSLGPRLGFQVQDNALPIVEYYRHNEDGSIAGCWLYVPVAG